MKNVKVHLLNQSYCQKPDKKEIAYISQIITEEIKEIDIETFAKSAGEEGKPFTPAIFDGSRKEEDFISQEIFALDFDDGITIEEFLKRADVCEIVPAFIYSTYNHTEYNQRFRAVFVNDCTVENCRAARILLSLLLYIFPEADKCCKDVSRLFLGGKRLIYFNENAEISIRDIVIAVQARVLKENSKNYARTIEQIGKKLSIAVSKNLLCIHRLSEIGEIEENQTNPHYIIMGDARNSSKCYIIESPHLHHASIRTEELKEIRNKSCLEIAKVCPLFEDFYKMDIPHEAKFLLATNLIHVKGGKNFFFEGLKRHNEKWKIDWKYIRACDYQPQNCQSINCPYSDICKCKSLYEKLSRRIVRVAPEVTYVPLEKASDMFLQSLQYALEQNGNGIYLITAQTAIGKTTAYCNLAKNWHCKVPLMIVVPTIKLQQQVFCDLKTYVSDIYMTPNIGKLLTALDLQDLQIEIDELYRKGFGYRVKNTIKEFIKANKEELTQFQKKELNEYLNAAQKLNGESLVITTHAMLLSLPESVLSQYEIIVDEDILMTVFKNTASISFGELKLVLQTAGIPGGLKSKIYKLMKMTDGTVGKSESIKLDIRQLEQLYEEKLSIQSSLTAFMESDTFHVDVKEEQIHFFMARKLPNVKLTIVSATLNEKLYKDYCVGRFVSIQKISLVQYTGKLKQYTAHSMSRSFMKEIGIEEIQKSINSITGKPDINQVTFKMVDTKKSIYFGKTEGFNDYKGQDLAIIGTPHNVPFVYQLIGKYLGYKADEGLNVRMVENNGYSFCIMTFEDVDMRNLQYYFLESELEQAIGRARLLRYDCTVYLFSNFPCRQAEIIQDEYLNNM